MKRFTTLVTSRMKSFTLMLMVAFTAIGFTSCEDEYVGMSLVGTWGGYVTMDVFGSRYGTSRDRMDVDIVFTQDPFHVKSGSGVEYDYVTKFPKEYPFNYYVKNRVIYIDYYDGTQVAISKYSINHTLDGDVFRGVFQDYDTGKKLADFFFVKYDEPRAKAMTQTELEE